MPRVACQFSWPRQVRTDIGIRQRLESGRKHAGRLQCVDPEFPVFAAHDGDGRCDLVRRRRFEIDFLHHPAVDVQRLHVIRLADRFDRRAIQHAAARVLANRRREAVHEQIDLAEVALDPFDYLRLHLIGERIAIERFCIQTRGMSARFERTIVVPTRGRGAIAFGRFFERDAERGGACTERVDDAQCEAVPTRRTKHQHSLRAVRELAARFYRADLLVDMRCTPFRMRSRADEASNAWFDDHRRLLQWLTDHTFAHRTTHCGGYVESPRTIALDRDLRAQTRTEFVIAIAVEREHA